MAYRSSANTTSAGSTSLAVNMPAGIVAGDRLIAVFSFDHAVQPTAVSCTGWTSLGNQTVTQDGETQWAFERVATGSEGATQTFSINASTPTAVRVDAFSGRSSGALTFATFSKDDSNLTSPISASITGGTRVAGDDVAVYISVDQQVAAARWSRSVTGYTNRGTVAELDWSSISCASADNASAGATGSIAATLTRTTGTGNAAWMALVVSIPQGTVALGLASGSGTAPAPSVQSVQPVTIGLASATAAAPAPSVQSVQPVSIGLASASAQAPAPVVGSGDIALGVASATAAAPAPTAQSVQPVSLGLAAAVGQAFAVVATNVVSLGVAVANGAAYALQVGAQTARRGAAGLWNSRRGRGRR